MIQNVYPELGQMNYTVNETKTVMFVCSATGIPDPTITWYRNGTELSGPRLMTGDLSAMDFIRDGDNEIVRMVTRTLQLTDTEDADLGTYTCSATNNVGNDQETFELIVQSKLSQQANYYASCYRSRSWQPFYIAHLKQN